MGIIRQTYLLLLIFFYLALSGTKLFAREELFIFKTDRQIYASGETIWFAANFNKNNEALSGIFYVDIQNTENQIVLGGKYELIKPITSGGIVIPKNLTPGNYYIRAYTKWTTNFNKFAVQPISIIGNGAISLPIVKLINSELLKSNHDSLNIQVHTKTLNARDSLRYSIINRSAKTDITGNISIVPHLAASNTNLAQKQTFNSHNTTEYLPEKEGVTITGMVINEKTGQGKPFVRVDISSLESKDIFRCTSTDDSGKFQIAFPGVYGIKDVVISVASTDSLSLQIDNDFAPSVSFPHKIANSVSDSFINTALSIYQNTVLSSHFRIEPTIVQQKEPSGFFYGKASHSVYPSEFVSLPTIGDYILELVPGAYVRTKNGQKSIEIIEKNLSYTGLEPLLLIDGIPVYDYNSFLNINPKLLHKIELIRSPYLHGHFIFGGIINLISKNNDLAGVKLNSSHLIIKSVFLSQENQFKAIIPEKSNIPDLRNTIYWNPFVEIKGGSIITETIVLPDTPGKYTLMFSGTNDKDEVIITYQNFTISK